MKLTDRELRIKSSYKVNNKALKVKLSAVKAVESRGLQIRNSKLKSAASRINLPMEFSVYRDYIEENTGKKFTEDVKFTKEEVLSFDKIIIQSFSEPNFDFKGLSLDLLIKAARITSEEFGFFELSSNPVTSIEDSAQMLPSNTSSGYPIFKPKGQYAPLKDATEWVTNFINNPSDDDIMRQPTAVFHRFQYKIKQTIEGASSHIAKKIRPVWGVSFRVLLFESWIFRNMVENYVYKMSNSSEPIVATGMTKKEISTKCVSRLRKYSGDIVSTDFTLFDSTVPSSAWALFYASIEECFINSDVKPQHLRCMMFFHCYTPYCWNSTELIFQ
jgi:hypothetical protein